MFKRFLPEVRSRALETARPFDLADFLDDFLGVPRERFRFRDFGYPAVDVHDGDKEITVKAELPGLESKDVTLKLDKGVLTLAGEKRFEDEDRKEAYHRIERRYGSFYREIPLPAEVKAEEVTARFDKGVLTVALPKAESSASRTIPVQ